MMTKDYRNGRNFYLKCLTTNQFITSHGFGAGRGVIRFSDKEIKYTLDSVRFDRYCILHENRDNISITKFRIFCHNGDYNNFIMDNELSVSKMQDYFYQTVFKEIDVRKENVNLLHIENHFCDHPKSTHRYMIQLKNQLLNSEVKHNLVKMTNMVGRRKHYFIPDQKTMSLFKMFYSDTILLIFDFEENRMVTDIRS